MIVNQGTIENNGAIDGTGTINNSGTANDHSAGISVTVNGAEAVNKPSEVKITFWNGENGQITQASYGDTITVQAEAAQKNTHLRTAAPNQVIFKIGSTVLETASVTNDIAALSLTLTGDSWKPGSYPITAEYGGGAGLLPGSSGAADLTVVKASPALSLDVNPESSLSLPGKVTLTATLSGVLPSYSGKSITFTVNNVSHHVTTNHSGVAVFTMENPSQGTYKFGASFGGDTNNKKRSLTGAAIALEAGPFKQTGSAIEPAVTGAVVGGITVPAAAYDVSYQNNINAGAATVTVTAKAGGNFSDKASTTFTIQEPDKPSGGGSVHGRKHHLCRRSRRFKRVPGRGEAHWRSPGL